MKPAKNSPTDKDGAPSPTPDTRPSPAVHHLYDHHDPIPVPEAHESNTESVWALFEQADGHQTGRPQPRPPPEGDGFGATQPAPLEGLERRQSDFDAPTEYSPLLSDFDLPTRQAPLTGGSDFDDTTRAASLHPDFDAPTQAAPLGPRRKPR